MKHFKSTFIILFGLSIILNLNQCGKTESKMMKVTASYKCDLILDGHGDVFNTLSGFEINGAQVKAQMVRMDKGDEGAGFIKETATGTFDWKGTQLVLTIGGETSEWFGSSEDTYIFSEKKHFAAYSIDKQLVEKARKKSEASEIGMNGYGDISFCKKK